MKRRLLSFGMSAALALNIIGAAVPAIAKAGAWTEVWTDTCTYSAPGSTLSLGTVPVALNVGDVFYVTAEASVQGVNNQNFSVGLHALWQPGIAYLASSSPYILTPSTTIRGGPYATWAAWPGLWTSSTYTVSNQGQTVYGACNGQGIQTPWGSSTFRLHLFKWTLAFNGSCAPNEVVNHYTAVQQATGSTTYKNAYGTAKVQRLYPCTGTLSASQVFPAALQASNNLGETRIVQLGYEMASADTVPWFVYTPADNQSGALAAATWFQGGMPTIGQTYGFSVSSLKIGNNIQWTYCINDGTQHCFTDYAGTWQSGTYAWFGYETHNVNDALGVRYGDPAGLIWGMGVSDTHGHVTQVVGAGICQSRDAGLAYYHCDSAQVSGTPNDAINGYTTAH